MDSLAHNLFLLMLNLAQINNRERILAIYVEAVEDLFAGLHLVFHLPSDLSPAHGLEIATPQRRFGWFQLVGDLNALSPENLALLRNSASMLSIILENRTQAELLENRVEVQGIRQRQVEIALLESEDRFQTIWQVTADALLLTDLLGVVLAANPAFTQLIGTPLDQMIGQPFERMVVPERRPALLQAFRGLFDGPDHNMLELNFKHPDGSALILEARVVFFTNDGQRVAMLATIRDISERKQAEVHLRQALTEKETLLRELYHRTKNNMQVICSMLGLQAEYSQEASVQRVCREIETRIHSMALVHQKLYQSSNLSEVDLVSYIEDLSMYFLQIGWGKPNRVQFVHELAPVSVQIDVAVPLGLILSELISNALQHAFTNERSGQITIALGELPNGQLELRVSDDGVGLPPGFNYRQSETIGLQTLLALAEHQLHGQVSFAPGPNGGLTCTVRFERKLYGLRV